MHVELWDNNLVFGVVILDNNNNIEKERNERSRQ